MMTMSSMTDSLIASDPSKSAFLEFGHGLSSHQEHSPALSHNHYPVHGLHSGGHPQHEGPFSPSASSYSRSLAYPYPGSVKIWFQNKRSKYKKIMKHGPSGPEGEHLHTTSSISPCPPNIPHLWDVSMANKGAPIPASSYMNNFGHWYPTHHQDNMPRPQMM
ncbi:Homeobox protein Dlx4b [Acipenser ruthenus]|uniref:Homeobox protein Dlx4b n=1 Tax=Acipenser ruthenus TaxID=7906 RepID=A0A444TZU1_ACIRT|nr:Homeobox protein Dlx4b [Acipenser ruthenus]